MAVVNPWEVSGSIDYEKLVREFGLHPFPDLPKKFQDFPLFRRKIIFGQRDFSKILEAIKTKKPFVLMTGLMPSGKFHFGHKMVADQIIFYQSLGAKVYLTVADIEAYNSRIPNVEKLRETAIQEYLTNYVAMGLDLNKCDFYFQSQRSLNGKKSNAYYRLASMFARHTTQNQFKAAYGNVSPGKMSASLLQASDMYHPQLPEFEGGPRPTIVCVGADQDVHIRYARGMAKAMKVHKFIPLSSTSHMFMPGLKGGKMSSSDETSYIALTDTPKVATKKVRKYAFSGGQATIAEHRAKGGNPHIDISYQMLRYGLEPSDKKLKKVHDDYKAGDLLTGELKNLVVDRLISFLESHQEKRDKAKDKVEGFMADLS